MIRPAGRAVLALALALAALLLGAEARADRESARVRVRGSGASSITRAISRTLASHGVVVVKSRRKPVSLRIEGHVRPSSRGRERVTVEITARRATGERIGELRVRAASPRAAARRVERELWDAIGPSLDAEPPAEVAEPTPDPPPRDPPRRRRVARAERPEPTERAGGTETATLKSWPSIDLTEGRTDDRTDDGPWISVSIGPELYGRHFTYRDDVFDALSEYTVTATPALTAVAEVYPMAHRSRGLAAHLGAAGQFTHVPSFDTEDLDGAEYTSEARSYAVGARYRQRLAAVHLAGALDFGSQSFSIAAAEGAMAPDFPAVRYRYLRAGLSATAPLFSRYALAAAAGYRQVLSSGEIESSAFFPRASARGIDLQLELAAQLRWGLDVRAGAALERYGFALNPEPGDTRVAGGALDQYTRFYVRVGFTR